MVQNTLLIYYDVIPYTFGYLFLYLSRSPKHNSTSITKYGLENVVDHYFSTLTINELFFFISYIISKLYGQYSIPTNRIFKTKNYN